MVEQGFRDQAFSLTPWSLQYDRVYATKPIIVKVSRECGIQEVNYLGYQVIHEGSQMQTLDKHLQIHAQCYIDRIES